MFGQASEAEGEEEEADEDAPAATGNSILPDYVIALQAADDFLCKRVMQLPERELEVLFLCQLSIKCRFLTKS